MLVVNVQIKALLLTNKKKIIKKILQKKNFELRNNLIIYNN